MKYGSKVEIGILNCETGKQVKRTILERNDPSMTSGEFDSMVLDHLKRFTKWFDKQGPLFFSRPVWDIWTDPDCLGEICRYEAFLKNSYPEVVCSDLFIEKGNSIKGVRHEIYLKRLK